MSAADVPSPWQRRPSAPAKLPDYEHPPLVQVTLSTWFLDEIELPADVQRLVHTEFGPDWNVEQLPAGWKWRTRSGDQEIRLNSTSLWYEWNGQAGDRYPHYPLVREGFISIWNALSRAVSAPLVVDQWYVEYCNRIPKGTVWTTLADCSFLRWMSPLAPVDGLTTPDGLQAQWSFPLDQFGARLVVALNSWPCQEDDVWPDTEQPYIQLQLSCFGRVNDPDDTFLAGFDYGREVIVRTFRQLMQPAANAYWGLKT